MISCQTWDRECHGLYDFDLKEFFTQDSLEFIGCGYVQRLKEKIRMELPGLATEQADPNPEVKENEMPDIENLMSVVYKNDAYWLFHNQAVESDYSYKNHLRMVWQIVRYSQDWQHNLYSDNIAYLEEGDIIKFGRVRFKIRKLRI